MLTSKATNQRVKSIRKVTWLVGLSISHKRRMATSKGRSTEFVLTRTPVTYMYSQLFSKPPADLKHTSSPLWENHSLWLPTSYIQDPSDISQNSFSTPSTYLHLTHCCPDSACAHHLFSQGGDNLVSSWADQAKSRHLCLGDIRLQSQEGSNSLKPSVINSCSNSPAQGRYPQVCF